MSNDFSFAAAGRAIDGAVSRLVHDLVAPAPPRGEELNKAVGDFGAVRSQTIDMVKDVSQDQADFSPGSSVWSVAQILDHLLLSEKLYREQMRKLIDLARAGKATTIEITLQQVNTSIAFIPREIIPFFATPLKIFNRFVPHFVRENMIRYPLIPALNPAVSKPARSRPMAEIRAELATSFEATEETFRGDLPPNLGNMRLEHPILGNNNIVEIFRVMAAHEERHQGQMRGVMGNPRFPKPLRRRDF